MLLNPNKLPSRFQIGDSVLAGRLDGGKPGIVRAVQFNEYKVSYIVQEKDGRTKKHLSERVHPGPDYAAVADEVLAPA